MSASSANPQSVVMPFLVLCGRVCFTMQVQHVGAWLLLNVSNVLNSEADVFFFLGQAKVRTRKCRRHPHSKTAVYCLLFYRNGWPSGPLQQAAKLLLGAL